MILLLTLKKSPNCRNPKLGLTNPNPKYEELRAAGTYLRATVLVVVRHHYGHRLMSASSLGLIPEQHRCLPRRLAARLLVRLSSSGTRLPCRIR